MTPQQPQGKDWEERLQYEVMYDYLMHAEYRHAAIDPIKHMEEMREHWGKLRDFIHTLLAEKRSRIMRVVEGMPHINPDDINMYYTSDQKAEIRAYNQALDDIKALLEDKRNFRDV